ncbi:MAG: MATE family efflux transporter [Firmicutes bacterium]|nr:MATE family efflux transporter [Bacillota bacterium]
MKIQLSDHFTFKRLLRFTFPSIMMMIFTSIYGVVDGFFVSNFVGKIPFAAVNFVMPLAMVLCSLGFMFGTGGSALVAKVMGEGDKKKARSIFSLIVYTSLICGGILTIVGWFILRPVCVLMGAEGQLLADCMTYGRVLVFGLIPFILQLEFQSFFIAAERPVLGFWTTVACGVTNMVLDALLVAILEWGLVGAALATVLAQVVGGVIPLIYFFSPNTSLLRLRKTTFQGKVLLKTFTNGSSELMTNVSMSLVGMLYNVQLLKYAGEDGVAAYGVIMYVGFIFFAAFIGYSIGAAPIISYHYGAQNHPEMKNLRKKSLAIILVFALCMFAGAQLLAKPLSALFVGYDPELFLLTCRGLRIYAFSFLLAGFAIFGSNFFTALNNGLISALISFLRTLVFEMFAVLTFPLIWGVDGIWSAVVAAEAMAVILTFSFMAAFRKKYNY